MLTDMKIRLVILEIKVPTVKAGSRSGTKHPGRGAGGRRTCDAFDFEHVTFEFSSSDPCGTFQKEV